MNQELRESITINVEVHRSGLIVDKENGMPVGFASREILADLPKAIEGRKIKSRCLYCGKEYYIEYDSDMSTRDDRKRVYPVEEDREGINSEACRECGHNVAFWVPGAQYEERL